MNRTAQWAARAVVAALTLTGCAATESLAVDGSPSEAAAPDASEGTWDPANWVPTEKTEQRMTDETERERWYEQNKARQAAGLGIESPPPVTRRGWATSSEEHERWVAQCMREHGVPAAYDEVRGGISWGTPPASQEDAYMLAN